VSVRHFLDIDGAATLPTEQLSLVDQAVADLVAGLCRSAGVGRVDEQIARNGFALHGGVRARATATAP